MKMSAVFFSVVIYGICLTGCNAKKIQEKNFGSKYNDERILLGIPIIEKKWVPFYPIDDMIEWDTEKVIYNVNRPQHLMKSIKIENGVRIYEEDTFFSYVNDTLSLKLKLKYSFIDSINSWSSCLIKQKTVQVNINGIKDEVLREEKKVISNDEAYKTLTHWGFKCMYP